MKQIIYTNYYLSKFQFFEKISRFESLKFVAPLRKKILFTQNGSYGWKKYGVLRKSSHYKRNDAIDLNRKMKFYVLESPSINYP